MEEDELIAGKLPDKHSGKVRKHTVLETSKGKLYVCKLCNENFDKSYALANHVKSFCPKRALKKDTVPSYLGNDTSIEQDIQDEPSPEIKISKRLRGAKRQKSQETPPSHSTLPSSVTDYDNPLRATNPGIAIHIDEYEKTFVPNYPLELVFKLKQLKALQLAMNSSLITPDQYSAKQLKFLESVAF